eukprot:1893892-Amphidinium_carterae.1
MGSPFKQKGSGSCGSCPFWPKLVLERRRCCCTANLLDDIENLSAVTKCTQWLHGVSRCKSKARRTQESPNSAPIMMSASLEVAKVSVAASDRACDLWAVLLALTILADSACSLLQEKDIGASDTRPSSLL